MPRCPSGRRPATDHSHGLVLPGCQVLRPVAAWSARVPGRGWRCLPRAEQGPHDLSVWLGVVQPHWSRSARMRCSPRPVSSREPGIRGAGAVLPGSATAHSTRGPGWSRPSRIGCRGRVSPDPGRACRSALASSSDTTIAMSGLRSAMPRWCRVVTVKSRAVRTDPGSAPSARVATAAARPSARGRDPVVAASCRSPGRPSPRPASASGSRRCPPGMTGALPSPPGRCHRASRIGVCRFCDHQVPAGLTGLTRCRQAAAASSPGSDRMKDRTAGMGGTDGVSGVSATGHGLIGRGIVVPSRLRPAGRGVAAGSAAGGPAAARRGWDPGGPGDGRVPVPRHDRAGGPVAGVVLLALGAG